MSGALEGSRGLAGGTNPVQLEPVGLDDVARMSSHLIDHVLEAVILRLVGPAAPRADDVVVMGRFAWNIGVLAGRQIQALQDLQVREQVKCAEDGGPTDAQATVARLIYQVRRREVAVTLLDQLRDGATGFGEPVSGLIECRHERLWFSHRAR